MNELSDKIANILLTDGEGASVDLEHVMNTLQEVYEYVLNCETLYPPNEERTAKRIQDEPWYSQYQSVLECMAAGDNGFPFELRYDGLQMAIDLCKEKAYLDGISYERLTVWICSIMVNYSGNIELLRRKEEFDKLAALRPDNYDEFSPEDKEKLDDFLGLQKSDD